MSISVTINTKCSLPFKGLTFLLSIFPPGISALLELSNAEYLVECHISLKIKQTLETSKKNKFNGISLKIGKKGIGEEKNPNKKRKLLLLKTKTYNK